MSMTEQEAAVFNRKDFPLTMPQDDCESISAWAQREYVECMEQGAAFAAHGDRWIYHYGQPWAWSMDVPNAAAVRARRAEEY